jgi:hypothetical protein
MTHRAHPGIVKRLKRTEGHLHQMIAMIEEDPPLPRTRPTAPGGRKRDRQC